MRGVRVGAQIYNCHKCDDSFELSGDLATHVRLHSGEMAFNCELCNFPSNTLDRLKTHIQFTMEKKLSVANNANILAIKLDN